MTKRWSALDGLDAALAQGGPLVPGVALSQGSYEGIAVLSEAPRRAQLNLRTDASAWAVREIISAVAGLSLPTEPNTVTEEGGAAALWLGPDEWLITCDFERALSLETALRARFGANKGTVVDVSAMRTILRLEGTAAREVLMKGCRLDVHPRAFAAGQCRQTLLAKADVLLHQIDDAPVYEIYVRHSFAHYLAAWLLDAMSEYGIEWSA